MTKSRKLKIFIIVLLSVPLFSFAQNIPDTLNVTLNPENPTPGQNISASVSAFEFNIDLAQIVWSLNGKVIESGKGNKNFSFTAPAAGKSTTLSVSVTPQGKSTLTKNIEIAPGGTVDLIWEVVDGYTPPFYRGKTLPIKQSAIKVIAVPNIKSKTITSIRPGDFAYSWRKDGSNVAGQSGLGKSSIVFVNQILEPSNRVEVKATNGLENVESSVDISPFNPEIIFYEYDQAKASAMYQKALVQTISIKQPRITIVAEPYFLAKDWKQNKNIVFDWKLNGQKANPGEKNTLGIITTTKGNIDVEANYNETNRLFRDIKANLRLTVN